MNREAQFSHNLLDFRYSHPFLPRGSQGGAASVPKTFHEAKRKLDVIIFISELGKRGNAPLFLCEKNFKFFGSPLEFGQIAHSLLQFFSVPFVFNSHRRENIPNV